MSQKFFFLFCFKIKKGYFQPRGSFIVFFDKKSWKIVKVLFWLDETLQIMFVSLCFSVCVCLFVCLLVFETTLKIIKVFLWPRKITFKLIKFWSSIRTSLQVYVLTLTKYLIIGLTMFTPLNGFRIT